jgi:hypothetical protein
MAKGPLSIYNVKGGRTGVRKQRAGIGTTGGARAGARTTHGSRDKVVTPVANKMIGNVGIFKVTVLNAIQKTGHGSLLRRGNHRRGAVSVIKASAIKTTDAFRIGTGMVEVAEKVATTTSRDEISDLTIVT